MPLEHITDHADRAEARLLTQYRDRPKMVALVRALVSPAQTIEDALYGMLAGRALATAIGAQLDGQGAIAGVARAGRDNDTYRLFIQVERLLNRSSGTIPELLHMFGLLVTPLGLNLELEEQFPAALVLRVKGGALATPDEFAAILQKGKAAGVRAILEWRATGEAECFSMAGGPGLGFGDATDPSVGGEFAGAEE